MGFIVSSLANYTEQNRLPLVAAAVFNAKTQQMVPNKRVGVKFQEAINLMDTDAQFLNGTSCGFTASGTTDFTQRVLHVGSAKVQETLCPRELENKWTATQLAQGANYENDSVPFEEQFAAQKAARIAANIEVALWQGVGSTGASISGQWTTTGNPVSSQLNLLRTSGLLNYAETTSAGTTDLTIGGVLNATNIISGFDVAYQNTNINILNRDDVTAFCGWDLFRILVAALVVQGGYTNLYAGRGDLGGQSGLMGVGELWYPGTNMRVVAVHGMNFTQRIFVCSARELFYGTDLLSDEDQFRIWASYDNDDVRFQAAFKYGINYAYPSNITIVKGNNAVLPKIK